MSWKVYPISEFKNHQDCWQRLNQEGTGSPLLEPAFISPMLYAYSSGKEILVRYESNNTILAMAILSSDGLGRWTTFQPSQAPLGAWIHSAGVDWPMLLSTLIKKLPGYPLILGITQQDPDLVPRPQNQATLKTLDYIQTARISLRGDFDSYWKSRGRRLRQNMRTQRNRLEKDAVTTRLQVSTAPEEVEQAITDYGRIESAGWKAKGGTAIHLQNTQGKFYLNMLEEFCRQGAGRIYRYWYNDDIVAMDLCIEGNGSIIILKTTYEESLNHRTAPALLMRQEAFKQLFSDGKLKRIEFYGRAMEWHTSLSDELRTLYHINEYRWPLLLLLHDIMSRLVATSNQGK
jgi:CelD/BcsL family acetyltransferase involved in cellulose biosynthesis